jgi:hypothetical protein
MKKQYDKVKLTQSIRTGKYIIEDMSGHFIREVKRYNDAKRIAFNISDEVYVDRSSNEKPFRISESPKTTHKCGSPFITPRTPKLK